MHIIRDGSDQAPAVLILAHGAGAGSDSEFMEWFAHSLTDPELAGGLVVCRIGFPYMIAKDEKVDGIVCLGYPFHPPCKPHKLRTKHLVDLNIPMLVCQGERDVFGHKGELANWQLSHSIQINWLKDGDHSFKPRKKSGVTEEENRTKACQAIVEFMAKV